MSDRAKATETNRDRVRRLVIDPLAETGFRFKQGTDPDKAKAHLNRITDALAHMSDEELDRMRASLQTKGEGSSRCFWPASATVLALAEVCHPRPMEEVPAIASWFRSAAGREALTADRLAAEFRFWEKKKRPPLNDVERRRIDETALNWRRKAQYIRERQQNGRLPDENDLSWLAWYEVLTARAKALVEGGQAA